MPFPSTAVDGQIVSVNGIAYIYGQTNNSWTKYAPTSANIVVTDTANVTSNTSSTSTTTGALRVAGGIGVQGNVFASAVYTNSYFYANGTAFSGGSAGTGYTGSAGTGFTGSAGVQGTIGYTGSAGSASSGSASYTSFVTRTYTGNGTTANYAVTTGVTVDSVIVTENGVVQTPTTDYTISGNVLTFITAPASSVAIGIREVPAAGSNSVYSRTIITATAGQTSFAVAYNIGFLEVYYNGALLPAADYTASNGSTVVLTDAAAADDQLEFITYNVISVATIPVATVNSTNLTANLAITAGYSAVSVGPISIANGVTVSIADGQKWVIL